MWVIETKYFEFYCKFYYFYKHFEVNMILWTNYLNNSRPCTKQVKNDTEKQWKKFIADVWIIIFSLTFNSMDSNYPEHLLVYYKFLKKKSLAYVVNFRHRFIAIPPFYCKWFLSIDNPVRRLLLLKIVLYSLFPDPIDGLRPNLAYTDPFWLICGCSICIKNFFFHSGRITFSRKWIPGHKSILHIKVSLLQRKNKKNRRIVRHTDVISENKRLKCLFMIPLQTIFF